MWSLIYSKRRIIPRLAGLILAGAVLAACIGPATSSSSQSGEPTLTPFQPIPASPAPEQVIVWLSPLLPESLAQAVVPMSQIDGTPILMTSNPGEADVRLEPGASIPLTHWVYALVAPFPTLTDNVTTDQLTQAWANGEHGFLLQTSHMETLSGLLGSFGGHDFQGDDQGLVDSAWSTGAWSIVPFEQLEPRWKVIAVDGVSPLDRDFDPSVYPLVITFGLSGDPAAVELLRPYIDWPSSNRDPDRLTTILMTGVTALTRVTAYKMEREGIDFPAAYILGWLQSADITHISNEVSFDPDCPAPYAEDVGMRFCSNPNYLELLTLIGTDVIELTGNHLKDYGQEPFDQTLAMYRQAGLQYFGGGDNLDVASQPVLFEHNGNRIAIMGCTINGPRADWATEDQAGTLLCDFDALDEQIAELTAQGYQVIFTFQHSETPYISFLMRRDFQRVADAGAAIVSGSQAHEPLGFEFYSQAFIHYGLGNLFFDQMQSVETRQEFLDLHVFYDGRHISTQLLTALLYDYAQPRPMEPAQRGEFLKRIFNMSGWSWYP
ncbi:MAG: CapA family protein [Anaerolineales bacterium]|jgi:poly-gamma-glutamate synthesis protein (capsule biosynthesis protein)